MRLWFEFGTYPLRLWYHCTDNNVKDIKWHDFMRGIEKRLDSKLWFGYRTEVTSFQSHDNFLTFYIK